MNKINYAIIGSNGHWANNIKNTLEKLDYSLARTCDLVGDGFLGIPHSNNLNDILNDKKVNAVIVCVPPEAHFDVVSKCLEKGKHTWCEKPLTLTLKGADKLLQIIRNSRTILHCDDTFCYSSEFYFIKNALRLSRFGKPISVKMTWAAKGKKQPCGTIFDLAPHIISQLFGWFGCPSYLKATAVRENKITQAANMIFTYQDNFNVYGEVSWLSPRKIRRFELTTEDGLLETDYDGIVRFIPLKGDAESYRLPNIGSPLEVELIHFNQCILDNKETLSNGSTGGRIVQLCELLEKSANWSGQEERL